MTDENSQPDATNEASSSLYEKQTEETEKKPDILYISGSPRSHTSEAVVALVEKGAKAAGARAQHFFLSNKRIVPCTGCGTCEKTGSCALANMTSRDKLIDDYLEFHALLDRADALVIVAPLYFAGPPSQLKALYDRLQPYWARRYILNEGPSPKRPAQLFIVGGGGDAHGYAPLVGITRSALAVAGFNLEKVHAFIGIKAKEDLPIMPPESERDDLALGELALLRRAVAAQADFEQRAVNAGGAFARYLEKIREKKELQKELQQIEAEIAALKADDEDTEKLETDIFSDPEVSLGDDELLVKSRVTKRSPRQTNLAREKSMTVEIAFEELKKSVSHDEAVRAEEKLRFELDDLEALDISIEEELDIGNSEIDIEDPPVTPEA